MAALLTPRDPKDTIERSVKAEWEDVCVKIIDGEILPEISSNPGDTTERNVKHEEEQVKTEGEEIPQQINPAHFFSKAITAIAHNTFQLETFARRLGHSLIPQQFDHFY